MKTMHNRRFCFLLLVSNVLVFIFGAAAGVWVFSAYVLDSHFARLQLASDSSETSYSLYRYAPPQIASRALMRHEELILQIVDGTDDEMERQSYLRELAETNARLSLLEMKMGNSLGAARRRATAAAFLKSSGSNWTDDELFEYVVLLDESLSEGVRRDGNESPRNKE